MQAPVATASRSPGILLLLFLLLSLAACATPPGKRQSVGEYLDDAIITAKVKAALLNDESIGGLAITVNTYNGVVQLAGFVESSREVRRAVAIAAGIRGVRDVKNDVIMKKRRTD